MNTKTYTNQKKYLPRKPTNILLIKKDQKINREKQILFYKQKRCQLKKNKP